MDTKLVQSVQENMKKETTEKLLEIWCQNDREQWSQEGLEAIRVLLIERGFTPPPQAVSAVMDQKQEGQRNKSVQRLQENLRPQTTEKLLEVWCQNDGKEWSPEAFEAMRALLRERGITPPGQRVVTVECLPGQQPNPDEDLSNSVGWLCAVMPIVGIIVALWNLAARRYRRALQAIVLPVANIAWFLIWCIILLEVPGVKGNPILDWLFFLGGVALVPFLTLSYLRNSDWPRRPAQPE